MSGAEGGVSGPMVSLAFRAVGGAAAFMDGRPADRVYVEKRDLKALVEEYIADGRLTLGEAVKPRLLELDGGGGFYVALLGGAAKIREDHRPSMHPVTVYDEERLILRLLKENRQQEFTEILRLYVKGNRRRSGASWRELKPTHYKPTADDARQSRTVMLLDLHPSMAEPWSLWGEYQKDKVAGFLAEALGSMYANSTLIRYGEAGGVGSCGGQLADLKGALMETILFNPERIMVLTDRLDPEPMAALDTLGRSGVRALVIDLGEGEHLYAGDAGAVQVLRVRAGGDLANMMRCLAAWA
jgi:hypothetical protein